MVYEIVRTGTVRIIVRTVRITTVRIIVRIIIIIVRTVRTGHGTTDWFQIGKGVRQGCILSHCFHCFPIYFPWSDGTGCHDLHFLNVEL